MNRYFIVNKPFDMVSQFESTHEVKLLGELNFSFPQGTHAVGRLDNHSEGLLILTTNKKVTRLLFLDKTPHKRTYLVKVRYEVKPETLEQLRNGVPIRVKGGEYYTTAPCDVEIVDDPAPLLASAGLTEDGPERWPAKPDTNTWLKMTLTEGKYHQVRKMVGVLHHRCTRLIRLSIEELALEGLKPGGVREMEEDKFFDLLKIKR